SISVGNGNNTYTVSSTPNTGNLTTLNTGTGTDTVNVQATIGPLTVNSQGSDVINVGNPAAVLGLGGPLTVTGQGGGAKVLNYNAQANPTAALTYTLSATGTGAGRVQRYGLADLTYCGITSLAVNPGTVGNQTVNVLSTAAATATALNGGQGNDTINVGDPGAVLNLAGPLTVTEQAGGTKVLNYNDQANP